MFGKITDLTMVRSLSESVVFYVGMSIFLVGLTTLTGSVLGTIGVGSTVIGGIFGGVALSTIIGTLFVLGLSGSIISHKRLSGDLLTVLLTVLAVYLSFTTSVFLGLLLVAYMTTLKVGK